jgi:two-component system cell cycle response regulator
VTRSPSVTVSRDAESQGRLDTGTQAFEEDEILRRYGNLRSTPWGGSFGAGRLLSGLLLALAAAYVAESLLLTGGPVDRFFDAWIYNGLLIAACGCCFARALLVRTERLPWLLLSCGLLLWTVGDLYFYFFLSGSESPPVPSVADPFYLAFYPVSYVALALLLRRRMRSFEGRLWLDGVIASLAVAALGAAVVFDEVLKTTGGSALVVATNLAYPLADVLLLALVVATFGLTGWRFDATWGFVAVGFAVFAIADSIYLYQTAAGTYVEGATLDVGWPAALVLIACAAWQPIRKLEGVRDESWQALTLPTFFAGVGLSLLVYDHFVRINTLALVLASATIAAVIVRAVLTFRERVQLLAASREEALTDALTGLSNRRRFVAELEDLLAATDEAHSITLVVFDLDGFKAYNDAFGHAAGDALLGRVAGRLDAAIDGYGRAYRLGGDEFCVLVSAAFAGPDVIARSVEALREEGDGFAVSCSYGAVSMPEEASDLSEALRIADDRMYQHKQRNRPIAEPQGIDVLVGLLRERDARAGRHLADVAELAEALSQRLQVPPSQLETIRQAAELHDVGKLAIPEEILGKPAPLTDDEWEFVRRHTLIGERILASAPALRAAAGIVRSSHERWDGTGYPDRLRGPEIPLGARIISVCDAFDAMTTTRPYAPPLASEEALSELVRCAGTQFDPEVVAAFASVQVDLNTELVA